MTGMRMMYGKFGVSYDLRKMPKTSSIALLVWRLAVRGEPPSGRVQK